MDSDLFDADSPGTLESVTVGPNEYDGFAPDPLPPDIDEGPVVAELTQAVRELARLGELGPRIGASEMLIEAFVRKEAVESSSIEGTRTTLSDLYVAEAGKAELIPGRRTRDDTQEVQNYLDALQHGLAQLEGGASIDTELLRECHRKLLTGVRGNRANPGFFRERANWIGGTDIDDARFVPGRPEKVEDRLDDLLAYATDPEPADEFQTLTRIGLVHYQFETIHPFVDGNGRMGRLLISLLLQKEGLLPAPYLYLSAYFDAHRSEYMDRLLEVSTEAAWIPWLRFFFGAIETQAREARERADRLIALRNTYRDRYATASSDAIQDVVMELFEQPYFGVQQMADRIDVDYTTARRAIRQLLDDGLIEEVTDRDYDRVYEAADIVRYLDEPVSRLPPANEI
jgi:Fic family protein